MTERSKEYNAMRKFTKTVKQYVDTNIYPKYFDSMTRVDDKTRFRLNNEIAFSFIKDKKRHTASEKFVIDNDNSRVLYFNIMHTDAHGKNVLSCGAKSQADVYVYLLWNPELKCINDYYFLDCKWLKEQARIVWQSYKDNNRMPENLACADGEKLQNGMMYRVYSLKFDVNELPDEAFFHIEKK